MKYHKSDDNFSLWGSFNSSCCNRFGSGFLLNTGREMATILCITPSGYLLWLGWWARSSALLIQPVLDNLKMSQIRGTLFPLMLVCKSIFSFYQLRSEILMRLRAGSTSSTTNTCPTRMPSETRSPSATGSTCEFHDFSFQRKRQTISAGKEENPDDE